MLEPGKAQQRLNIPFFEGVNSLTSFNIGKKTEFFHAENARSKTIGTIEKREGQTVLGTNANGLTFKTSANYGLFPFQNETNKGLYRISEPENVLISLSPSASSSSSLSPSSSRSPSASASMSPSSSLSPSSSQSLSPSASQSDSPSASLSPSASSSMSPSSSVSPSEFSNSSATIYYLNNSDRWIPLTGYGTGIEGGVFDYTYAEGNVFVVTQDAANRYIKSDGVTVVTSADGTGHLFNSPNANRINFYKNRLYLADFVRNGVRYKNTILRSSYPLGIIGLLNADYTAAVSGTELDVTETKYFYTDAGANQYDIYRGNTLIVTITVTQINESSIVATWSGTPDLLASDQIWVAGTYNGPKVFRWIQNSSSTGRDVTQYDSFKLSGGENDEITVLTNIGNVMFAANKNAMVSWNDYTLENFDLDVGCVSKKGYVKRIGTMYFIHYTGIYATSGGIPKLISNKIEKYITGATKYGKEHSAAGKKGKSVFFTLGDVTLYHLDGSINKVLPDVCVEFNTVQENWYIHTNVKAQEFATYVEATDSDRLEFIDKAGNKAVKEFLSGETDDGEAIHFRVDTMKLTTQPTTFEYSSKLIAAHVEAERGAAMQLFVNLENNEEYYPVEGTITKGLSVIKITDKDGNRGKPPYCRLVSLSIRDSSPQICKISRITLITLPTTDENMDNE